MWTTITSLLLLAASPTFEPCELEARQFGYWHITPWGGAWDLSVSPSGALTLVVHDPDRDRTLELQASSDQLKQLRAALSASDFMRLVDPPDSWGYWREHEDTRTIEVSCPGEVHEVTFGETPERTEGATQDELERMSRALHVWVAVRGLLADDEAVDTGAEDLRFLQRHPVDRRGAR